jgi:tRNA threonylcarbamoyladenosine biosynthesis protein TsaE
MLDDMRTVRLGVESLEHLPEQANVIIENGKGFDIWLFYGEMGAGKTTLIREICQQIGVEDNVNSPSFGLVNEYLTRQDETIYHFDFYRIKNEEEAGRIGLDEYFCSGNLCLIEWPEKISSMIPEKHFSIKLEITKDQQREISLNSYE